MTAISACDLTHPRYGVRKKYIAMVEGRVEPRCCSYSLRGIVYEGEKFKAEKARLVSAGQLAKAWWNWS